MRCALYARVSIDTFIHGVFDDVTDGWRHAVNSVHVVIGSCSYLDSG
jgi:hypothetical protein